MRQDLFLIPPHFSPSLQQILRPFESFFGEPPLVKLELERFEEDLLDVFELRELPRDERESLLEDLDRLDPPSDLLSRLEPREPGRGCFRYFVANSFTFLYS